MRLKWLYGYRLVRILRVLLPLLVLASIAVPLRNYLDRSAAEAEPSEALRRLDEGQSDLTAGLRYFVDEAGKTILSVEARRTLGFKDGKDLLEGVRVTFYGEDGSTPERRIEAVQCGFVQATGSVNCDGDVEMQLDENTTGHTTELTYDHGGRIVRTLAETRITRPDEFEARADTMILRMAVDEYVLDGNVRISTRKGAVLEADRVAYLERADRVDVAGDFHLVSRTGELHGGSGSVDLDRGTMRPRAVRAAQGTSAASFDPANPGELVADRLNIELSGGTARSVSARGDVTLDSGADADGWSLLGNRIDGSFNADGTLETLESRDGARMVIGPNRELRSGVIRKELSGLITTTTDSVLDIGEFRIEGRDFLILQGRIFEFTTQRDATIETPDGFFRGRRTEAEFDPEAGLISLIQTGDVEFQQADRSGSAERLQVRNGGAEVRLEGSAEVRESALSLQASEIVLSQEGRAFTALGAVEAWSSDPDDPFLVVGGRADRAGDSIVFSREAELWWTAADTQVSASSIDFRPDSRSFLAEGGVESTSGEVRVWSDRLDFDEAAGRVHYSGHVRAVTEDLRARCDDLEITLVDAEPRLIVAAGAVHISGPTFDGAGDRAEYAPSSRILTLTGERAEVSSAEFGNIRGNRLEVNLETENVAASAEGGGRVVSTGVSPPR